jgi:hypothetical protein
LGNIFPQLLPKMLVVLHTEFGFQLQRLCNLADNGVGGRRGVLQHKNNGSTKKGLAGGLAGWTLADQKSSFICYQKC